MPHGIAHLSSTSPPPPLHPTSSLTDLTEGLSLIDIQRKLKAQQVNIQKKNSINTKQTVSNLCARGKYLKGSRPNWLRTPEYNHLEGNPFPTTIHFEQFTIYPVNMDLPAPVF
ncbi:unnamed protein product [Boreogadus saida]